MINFILLLDFIYSIYCIYFTATMSNSQHHLQRFKLFRYILFYLSRIFIIPIFALEFVVTSAMMGEMNKLIDKLIEQRVVEPSNSA